MIHNTTQQYGAVARALHWWSAALFFILFFLGLYMSDLDDKDPSRITLVQLHISLGILILGFTLVRIYWKIKEIQPTPPATMTPLQIKLAKSMYGMLYLLLLAIPIAGYVIVTADGHTPSFFGLFDLPNLISKNEALEDFAEDTHEFLAYTAITLVGGHILMALKHHFIEKDETLLQMLGKVEEK